VASIERPKARRVSAAGGQSPSDPQPEPLSFTYCSINTVSLLSTVFDICAIGLLFR